MSMFFHNASRKTKTKSRGKDAIQKRLSKNVMRAKKREKGVIRYKITRVIRIDDVP